MPVPLRLILPGLGTCLDFMSVQSSQMNWVVVVDDEDFNRKTVSRVLKKNDYIVTALG